MQDKPQGRPPRVSLFSAANDLATICARIEDGDDLDAALIEAFEEARGLVTDNIDRRKAVLMELDSKVEVAKKYKSEADGYIKRFEVIKKRLKDRTREIMEQTPDIPYTDSMGKRLTICKSQPALRMKFDIKKPKSFSNVLDPDLIDLIGIEKKYIKEVTFYALDADAVKADLLAGEKLSWADIEQTTYLRGL